MNTPDSGPDTSIAALAKRPTGSSKSENPEGGISEMLRGPRGLSSVNPLAGSRHSVVFNKFNECFIELGIDRNALARNTLKLECSPSSLGRLRRSPYLEESARSCEK